MKAFKKKKVFVDTSPLIYLVEKHPRFFPVIKDFFVANNKGEFSIATSMITLSEVIVKPLSLKKHQLVEEYKKKLLFSAHFQITDIDRAIAIKAAEIRAEFNFKTPDALQIGAAVELNADYFLTNDLKLKSFKELPILTLDEL